MYLNLTEVAAAHSCTAQATNYLFCVSDVELHQHEQLHAAVHVLHCAQLTQQPPWSASAIDVLLIPAVAQHAASLSSHHSNRYLATEQGCRMHSCYAADISCSDFIGNFLIGK